MKHIFIGGIIHGETRENIKGNTFMVPKADGRGGFTWQIYHRVNLPDIIKRLEAQVKVKESISKNAQKNSLPMADKLDLKKQLAGLKAKLVHYKAFNYRHIDPDGAFEFYREIS